MRGEKCRGDIFLPFARGSVDILKETNFAGFFCSSSSDLDLRSGKKWTVARKMRWLQTPQYSSNPTVHTHTEKRSNRQKRSLFSPFPLLIILFAALARFQLGNFSDLASLSNVREDCGKNRALTWQRRISPPFFPPRKIRRDGRRTVYILRYRGNIPSPNSEILTSFYSGPSEPRWLSRTFSLAGTDGE